jgi:hypothetical protein
MGYKGWGEGKEVTNCTFSPTEMTVLFRRSRIGETPRATADSSAALRNDKQKDKQQPSNGAGKKAMALAKSNG